MWQFNNGWLSFFKKNAGKICIYCFIFFLGIFFVKKMSWTSAMQYIGDRTEFMSGSKQKLRLFSWGEWFDDEMIRKFEQENNCIVIMDYFSSNDAMVSKLLATKNAVEYDITFPSRDVIPPLVQANVIEQIEPGKIERKNVYLKHAYRVNGKSYSVPYLQSFSFLLCSQKLDKKDVQSWNVFGDKRFRKKISILNDRREIIGVALKMCGYSINSKSPSELKEAEQLLKIWRENIAIIESDLTGSDIALGNILLAMCDINKLAMQEDENMFPAFPREGLILASDEIAIIAGSKNKDLAYKFINFLCRVENIEIMCMKNASSSNFGSGKVWKEIVLKLGIDESIINRSEIVESVEEARHIYDAIWQKIQDGF